MTEGDAAGVEDVLVGAVWGRDEEAGCVVCATMRTGDAVWAIPPIRSAGTHSRVTVVLFIIVCLRCPTPTGIMVDTATII
jgi:hypothetical protein